MRKYSVAIRAYSGVVLETAIFNDKEQAIIKFEEYKSKYIENCEFVVLLNLKTSNVMRLLYFENGNIVGDFVDGDIVKLREGYYEVGEEEYLYIVTNMNENTGRCLISCINSGASIPAAENVEIKMIEFVSHRN